MPFYSLLFGKREYTVEKKHDLNHPAVFLGPTREAKEVWSLPIVDTEANGDSRSTCERGPSQVGSSCRY